MVIHKNPPIKIYLCIVKDLFHSWMLDKTKVKNVFKYKIKNEYKKAMIGSLGSLIPFHPISTWRFSSLF
jgi:hypothetical protein